MNIEILDSTLRDGAQAEGISFSVNDKLKIVAALDALGVTYIEAGNPASNPKDAEVFRRLIKAPPKSAKMAAFGSTARKSVRPEDDDNVRALIESGASTVVIFGKSWDFQVTEIIRAGLDENLTMIGDTIAYLIDNGKEVIFDAEHFFDGYKANSAYAISALKSAARAGARVLCLCDTNGGALPMDVYETVKSVCAAFVDKVIGIHCHNDSACAAANTILAAMAGARHVQGTFTGFGERCGNTSLCDVIPTLHIKMGYHCVPDLKELTPTARYVADVANVRCRGNAPYVGHSAFAHKGGMHIDGVLKNSRSFEHIDPAIVGNERRLLTSEVAGRGVLLGQIEKIIPGADKNAPVVAAILAAVKEKEAEGYQYEAAEASVALLIRRVLCEAGELSYKKPFELRHFEVFSQRPAPDDLTKAIVKIVAGGVDSIAAAEGDGPVNALDMALRKALDGFYSKELAYTRLTDYKVRVLDGGSATAAKVRVLIESTDGAQDWTTVGVSTDIIQASWKALTDSIEYKLLGVSV